GAELDDDGNRGRLDTPTRQIVGDLGHRAELDAALFDVGAGDVHLQDGDAPSSTRVQHASALDVALFVLAEEVHPDADAQVGQKGQLVAEERLGADVLETDRVEHPGGRLADPGEWIAGSGPRRDA